MQAALPDQPDRLSQPLPSAACMAPHARLHDAFFQAASSWPGKTAIACGHERASFADLLARTQTLTQTLRRWGVGLGDRVVVAIDASIDYAAALHAVLLMGAVVVPVSSNVKGDKLGFVLADTQATALLAEAKFHGQWHAAWSSQRHVTRVCLARGTATAWHDGVQPWPSITPFVGDETPASLSADDLAMLIYTSGSTGDPKGVMLTHGNMVSAWRAVRAYLPLHQDDVVVLPLAPTYSYGLYNLLMALGVGATVVLETRSAMPAVLARTLEESRATLLPGVPTLFAGLLELDHFKQLHLPHLRTVTNAAAAWPVAHIERIADQWAHARIYSMYGLTECKRASYLSPDDLASRPWSVGKGLPHQTHWLIDEHGERVPHGGTGELVVHGPHVMKGYWRRPDTTAQRLRLDPASGATALHTGDLFRTDAQGYLSFVGRMDDVIKSRGEKVSPREVEDAIHRLAAVSGCAVVGVDDDRLGQAVKAVVVVRPGHRLEARDVVRHCQRLLEPHCVPTHVAFVDALPRTESGKVRHAGLRSSQHVREATELTSTPNHRPSQT